MTRFTLRDVVEPGDRYRNFTDPTQDIDPDDDDLDDEDDQE